jgi:hypothetical protein
VTRSARLNSGRSRDDGGGDGDDGDDGAIDAASPQCAAHGASGGDDGGGDGGIAPTGYFHPLTPPVRFHPRPAVPRPRSGSAEATQRRNLLSKRRSVPDSDLAQPAPPRTRRASPSLPTGRRSFFPYCSLQSFAGALPDRLQRGLRAMVPLERSPQAGAPRPCQSFACRRNCSSRRLTSPGCSCCTQWPAPSTR